MGDLDWQCMGIGSIGQDICAREHKRWDRREEPTGLRQGVQRVAPDMKETGNGIEDVMCNH